MAEGRAPGADIQKIGEWFTIDSLARSAQDEDGTSVITGKL